MKNDIEYVAFSEEAIKTRIEELGAQLSADYSDKNPLFIGVLKGAFVFLADLIRNVSIQCEVEFLGVSSYGSGATTTGAVKITKDLSCDIEGRHIILVEDILDTGITLTYLKNYLEAHNPASIKICAFLDKTARRKVPISADYLGFECDDVFLVGYGLDFAERYRGLPYIGVLKPELYL